MAHQGIIPNPEGLWCFRCRTCLEVFTSSQSLAGHQLKHKSEGTWIKGAPHEKFFCPAADLPALYRQLEQRKPSPAMLPGEGRLRNQVVQEPNRQPGCPWSMLQEPCRVPGCPWSILDQSQQAMVLQVPHVAAPAPITPLIIQDPNLFDNHLNQPVKSTNVDDQEELDLELRL